MGKREKEAQREGRKRGPKGEEQKAGWRVYSNS